MSRKRHNSGNLSNLFPEGYDDVLRDWMLCVNHPCGPCLPLHGLIGLPGKRGLRLRVGLAQGRRIGGHCGMYVQTKIVPDRSDDIFQARSQVSVVNGCITKSG